jgi:hypothetical protein
MIDANPSETQLVILISQGPSNTSNNYGEPKAQQPVENPINPLDPDVGAMGVDVRG